MRAAIRRDERIPNSILFSLKIGKKVKIE